MTDLATQVKAALESAGYEIREGKADLFDIEGAHGLAEPFGTCFGNNPAAPYIVPALPHLSSEPYDYGPSMESKLMNGQNEKLYWTYRLEEHEAILMFGNLPPAAAFIGYEPFLFTRHFDSNNLLSSDMDWLTDNIGLQQHLSPNPDNLIYDHAPTYDGTGYSNDPNRVVLFANGPRINRRDFESRFGNDFWGQQAILSTSADAGFEEALNNALGETLAGIHFHSPLAKNLKMGLGYKADDFWTLMRYAVPVDSDAADDWRDNVANELVVLRVSKPGASVVRHPTYEFESKAAETKDERSLAVDLQKVADAVGEALDFGKQEVCVPLSATLHAPMTIPKAMSAVGATHDAHYGVSAARAFGEGEALAIVGVNHNRTKNSSYISLGIYDASIWLGIRGISQALDHPDPGVLNDSAQRFFETLDGVPASLNGVDLSNFYIHVVTRPDADLDQNLMGSTLCTVVQDEGSQIQDAVELALDKPLRMSERAYLNPDAHCGPDGKKLLSMLLLAKGAGASSKSTRRGRRSSK